MYNNVLIITDNLFLSDKIEKIVELPAFNDVNWNFAISLFSNFNEFNTSIKKNLYVYNLKNQSDVEEIVAKFDLVISIHCKQIFPEELFRRVKCINVHPGYNPINRGWYPQVFAIINDLPIGATIHEITSDLDNGPIIIREYVKSEITDTSESLYFKVINKELELFEQYLTVIIQGTYKTTQPKGDGNLFLKKDFDSLKELKLNEQMTNIQFINKLRALSHGNYKNAFFIDPETGDKIYVTINLSK